jgi:lysophospholipase L1-like esterase
MRLGAVANVVALAFLSSSVIGAEASSKPAKGSAKKKESTKAKQTKKTADVKDDPSLPRVLLIGDSITQGYCESVRAALQGKANVHIIPENGATTANGLKNLKKWLGKGKWDVIHFNWGLHDLKLMKDGKHQVPVDQYEKNLRTLVKQLKATKARLIWASTTPVPEGKLSPSRKPGDEVAYNAAARKVMDENQIPIDDLYALALPKLAELQTPANVHFTPKGSEVLGKHVAESIQSHLGKATTPGKASKTQGKAKTARHNQIAKASRTQK